MKKRSFYKTIAPVFVLLLLLTSCGQEKPPVYYNPPVSSNTGNTGNDQTEFTEFVDNIPENNGNSKPLDYSPCEGIHVKAEENAFWQDTVVNFIPIDDSTPNINEIEQHFYDDEGIAILSGFEVDAGLEDDEFIPGQYDVEYDLSTTEIDPELYENLKVFRVGDDGEYYEMNTVLDGNIIKFSSNQNSLFVTAIIVTGICAIAGVDYYQRNKYYMDNAKIVYRYDGKNDFGSYFIEWALEDIVDPELYDKLVKAAEIEKKHIKKAEAYRKTTDIFGRLHSNEQAMSYLKKLLKEDKEYQELKKQIEVPEIIRYTAQCIDNAFLYLYRQEWMRMPLHTVPFKNVKDEKDSDKKESDYGNAVNRYVSNSYIEIRLHKVMEEGDDGKYNLLLTLTHELLHICQNRYRFPIDKMTDNTRFDEMIAMVTEPKALAYFKEKKIIPESANPKLVQSDYYGNLRLPIDGEEDGKLKGKDRNEAVIGEGYTLGHLLEFIFDKVGKRPKVHYMMKARSFITTGSIPEAICKFMEIDSRTFDLYYRNWLMSERFAIGAAAMGFCMDENYQKMGIPALVKTKKGEKYHIDLAHGASYFLNLRCFEPDDKSDQIMILVPDKELRDVFPSSNIAPGTNHRAITAGAYFDKLAKYGNVKNLPVLEILGDTSKDDLNKNVGYTLYVLDKTPSVRLNEKDDKLQIVLPTPEPVAADGVADGYILKITTGKGKTIEKEIPKEYFGKVLEMNKSELYDKDDEGEDLNVKATLNEFFLEGDNKIMGIESDEMSIQTGGEQCEIVIVKNKVTYKLSVKGAIVYGEDPKGIIYCQAKPGTPIDITVTSSDEKGIEIGLDDIIPSGKAYHWTMGDGGENPDYGYWLMMNGKNAKNEKFDVGLGHLVIYPVKEYTKKPLWTFEPSWSDTKRN